MIKKFSKIVACGVFAAVLICVSPNSVKADPVADALAAQQAALYQQQLQMMQAYQEALLAQYQQALMDQYQQALLAQQALAKQQMNAIQQAYLLNAIQAQQKAQYESMLNATGLEYKDQLMQEYIKNQNNAKTAFKGYEGIK